MKLSKGKMRSYFLVKIIPNLDRHITSLVNGSINMESWTYTQCNTNIANKRLVYISYENDQHYLLYYQSYGVCNGNA